MRESIVHRGHVLIVEDNQDLREVFAKVLGFAGYQFSVATTGREAIEMSVTTLPDIILMNVSLPDMRGTEAARWIKNNPRTTSIPIIAWSGLVGPNSREEALSAGMVDYLVKPFSAHELKYKIEKFIAWRR